MYPVYCICIVMLIFTVINIIVVVSAAAPAKMNKEQLARLQEQVRTGGKGSVRRKKKVVHRSASNSKKLQDYLKKLTENIPDIEEVGTRLRLACYLFQPHH